MSNHPEHLAKLKDGIEVWNQWRKQNPEVQPDLNATDLSSTNLQGADLHGAYFYEAYLRWANLNEADLHGAHLYTANLSGADLRGAGLQQTNLQQANLRGANLKGADLTEAGLRGANLSNAILSEAFLFGADLSGATLRKADLHGTNLRGANLTRTDLVRTNLNEASLLDADLTGANLSEADLSRTDLMGARLVNTNLEGTNLTGCFVYGISVWNVNLKDAIQKNLVITPRNESPIQVDNLEVAQFIYLLLNNEKIRDVIDTIGKKAVLILGRFTPERKAVLDAIREALRRHGYLPILFDFEKPSTRDTHETIVTLAGMARFIIADITDPKSIPQELASIVPNLPSVPVQPLLQSGLEPWGMYDHIRRYDWVLPVVTYENQEALLTKLQSKVIAPAEEKAKEQTRK